MSDINLQEIQDNLVAIAFEAGRMILGANVNKISRDTKLNCQSGQTTPPLLLLLLLADALHPPTIQPSTS